MRMRAFGPCWANVAGWHPAVVCLGSVSKWFEAIQGAPASQWCGATPICTQARSCVVGV